MPLLRHLLADLTSPPMAESPPAQAGPCHSLVGDSQSVAVPDLGPAVVVDQLAVLVWDAYAAGRGDGIPELLTAARRALV